MEDETCLKPIPSKNAETCTYIRRNKTIIQTVDMIFLRSNEGKQERIELKVKFLRWSWIL
jgi:hypothetical protein